MKQVAPPDVSVIIPTHDRLPFLKDATESVAAQTHGSWEVIIVDDASTDGTAEWLEGVRNDRVEPIVLPTNRGRAVARNEGLAIARGSFVLFLDDDDRLRASAVQRLSESLQRHPDAIAAVGARVLFDAHGRRRRTRHPRRSRERVVWTDLILDWLPVPGQVLWRIETIRRVGGWDEHLPLGQPDDKELWIRLSRHQPMVVIPDVVLETRIHPGQRKSSEGRRLHEQWLESYVDSLPPRHRILGRRTLGVARLLESAGLEYRDFRHRQALSLYLRALRSEPRILWSPLVRHRVLPPIAKSAIGVVAGKNVMVRARDIKGKARSNVRRLLGRDIERNKRLIDTPASHR